MANNESQARKRADALAQFSEARRMLKEGQVDLVRANAKIKRAEQLLEQSANAIRATWAQVGQQESARKSDWPERHLSLRTALSGPVERTMPKPRAEVASRNSARQDLFSAVIAIMSIPKHRILEFPILDRRKVSEQAHMKRVRQQDEDRRWRCASRFDNAIAGSQFAA